MGVECEYTHVSNHTASRTLADNVQHVTVQ